MAYQRTLDKVDALPAVVWLPWDSTGPGRFIKVPYLRLLLRFFVAHHISRNVTVINRRLQAMAALAEDPDAGKASREMVKYFQQSLPAPPYRSLIFGVIAAALVVALPLQWFGNVFYVLDLVGAFLRLDLSYVGRAFASKEVVPTIRSFMVLLIGLTVVGGVMTSPFALRRALFNSYPWRDEPLEKTAARSHGHRVDGIYRLEQEVFDRLGTRQPPEGRWDLGFQTFLLLLLLLLLPIPLLLTVAIVLNTTMRLEVDFGPVTPDLEISLPELPWPVYASITLVMLGCCLLLAWRLVNAWRERRRPSTVQRPRRRRAARQA
jgi:hypothetical protein